MSPALPKQETPVQSTPASEMPVINKATPAAATPAKAIITEHHKEQVHATDGYKTIHQVNAKCRIPTLRWR